MKAFTAKIVAVALALTMSGCISANSGSRTVVGEQMALPEISDSSDSVSVRVYESVKGAKVWTAKNCKVTINYKNDYHNVYFGAFDFTDTMNLSVCVEPDAENTEETEK